jgi:hypothetical protein
MNEEPDIAMRVAIRMEEKRGRICSPARQQRDMQYSLQVF